MRRVPPARSNSTYGGCNPQEVKVYGECGPHEVNVLRVPPAGCKSTAGVTCSKLRLVRVESAGETDFLRGALEPHTLRHPLWDPEWVVPPESDQQPELSDAPVPQLPGQPHFTRKVDEHWYTRRSGASCCCNGGLAARIPAGLIRLMRPQTILKII